MAEKQGSSLIHCSSCGEDYSSTYKFCPFCGEYNAPAASAPAHKSSGTRQTASKHPPKKESYQFDGQDVFDQSDDEAAAGKGGKRLAGSAPQRPTPPPPVNWPRLITFLCSLVIIAAALVMTFKVFYPHLRQVSNPNASDAPAQTASANPSVSAGDEENGLLGMSLDTADLTLQAEQSHPLELTFDPADWDGAVTWASSDETCATVNEEGVVTNVNTSGTQRRAVITATVGTQTVTCTVYCQSSTAVKPSATPTPTPTATPAPSQPASSGEIAEGSEGVVANASGGLRVRSGPGTDYEAAASLNNGDPITVLSYAGDGWYKISYAGYNGKKTGYIMGEYISVD